MASNVKKWSAEFLGTFWLTFGGCGSAVLAAAFPEVGIGLLGVSFAFGLTVLTALMPSVPSPAATSIRRSPSVWQWRGVSLCRAARLHHCPGPGRHRGGSPLYFIASGKAGAHVTDLATNGYGDHSPGKFNMAAALVTEVVLTAVFLLVILGSTTKKAAVGFAGMSIGLCLTLIHLISIPVTNTSVNPARSTGPALFGPAIALEQLWLFWLAPIVGAIIGAVIHKALLGDED
jgi:aquaporin Z